MLLLYQDCSSSLYHFEKHRDLPAMRSKDVEQFSIDGSLFLAFAIFKRGKYEFNTDSFIYKLNDSTGTFFLYQTIDTTGGADIEHFTIADKHYLAVANYFNGTSYRLNSVIYQWNGTQFGEFQNISTKGGFDFNFFKVLSELFLTVTNHYNGNSLSINSAIYKWKNNQFEQFQEIGTEGAVASTAFVINNETFIAFANRENPREVYSVPSSVFKWSGGSFVKVQSLQTQRAQDVKSFTINGSTFLAFANFGDGSNFDIDSSIYKWNGSHFALFQSIPTRGAQAWHPFVMCGQTFLGVANSKGKSVVYQTSGERFIKYQEISTQRAYDVTSFEYNGDIYLVIVNYDNGKYNISGVLYKWIKKGI